MPIHLHYGFRASPPATVRRPDNDNPSEMRHYSIFDLLIEFKYVPLNQLDKLTGQKIREKKHDELVSLKGVKQQLTQAQKQLSGYRKALEKKYDQRLKLRSYTVVAVGFERLIWEAVV